VHRNGLTINRRTADDAMAIFVALRSPELEVIGLTTIFGNVYTSLATRNALHLVSQLPRASVLMKRSE
jgi:inosine-uridine nucleoside N-ribohydrolase